MDTQETPVTETETDVTTPVTEPVIDYKAEYETIKERLKKSEYKHMQKNMAEKDSSEVVPVADLERIVDEKLAEKLSQVRERDTREDVDDALMKATDNPQERELIAFLYNNRIVKTGFSRTAIREDIDAAKLLANAKKFQKENTEMAQAMVAKQTMGNSSIGSNLDQPKAPDDTSKVFNAVELEWMKKQKFSEEQIKKAAQDIRQTRMSR